MRQLDGAIALMPYVCLDKPLAVGEFAFLPLEQALQAEPGRSEEKALRNTLTVFKHGGAMPEDELYRAVIASIRESKFRSLLRSNKARLDALLDLTCDPLTFDTILQARTLASMDGQDFSLTADDCSRYKDSLAARLETLRAVHEAEEELLKRQKEHQECH